MVKVILQLYPTIHAKDEEERRALRPIGRNVERYQDAIQGTFDIARFADEAGLWGISLIEHHFHSEGYELGPSPGVINAWWGAITKNIRVGQLGYVMSTQHPIRIAEETAVLDHMTKGRTFVGFARGYQDRWTNVVGQHLGARATHSTGDADDQTNRDIYTEQVEMVLEAWTQESIEHNTALWQIPNPYEEGIEWWMKSTTERLGAPGEIGEDGRVHRVSVVPAPYQKPHPPVFVPSLGSPASVDYCARKDFVLTHILGGERAIRVAPRYAEVARENGHDYALGQHQGVQRFLQIGKDRADARRLLARHDAEIFRNFYNQVYHVAAPDMALPRDASTEAIVDAFEGGGIGWVTGSKEEVRDKLVAQWRELPCEYIVVTWHYAQQPKDEVIEQLGIFMEDIKPALDELTPYENGA